MKWIVAIFTSSILLWWFYETSILMFIGGVIGLIGAVIIHIQTRNIKLENSERDTSKKGNNRGRAV